MSSPAVKVQEENAKLRSQLKKCLDDKLQLSKKRREAEEMHHEVAKRCQRLEEKVRLLESNKGIDMFERLMQENLFLSSSSNSQVKSLQSKLNTTEQELAEIKQELAETKQELAETKRRLAETEQELAQTKQELAETKQEVAETKRRLAQAELCITHLTKENAELKKENAELKKDNTELKKEVAELKVDMVKFVREMAEFKKQVNQITQSSESKKTMGEVGFYLDTVMRRKVFDEKDEERMKAVGRLTFNAVFNNTDMLLKNDEKPRFSAFVTSLESSVTTAERCAKLANLFKEGRFDQAHLDEESFTQLTTEDIEEAAKNTKYDKLATQTALKLFAFIIENLQSK